MTKSNVEAAQKRAQAQVENTSGGGQLGGTYYGQQPDGKTATTVNKDAAKDRANNGSN